MNYNQLRIHYEVQTKYYNRMMATQLRKQEQKRRYNGATNEQRK